MMKKRRAKVCFMLAVSLLVLSLPFSQADADTNTDTGTFSRSDYSLTIKVPENQIQGAADYFDLLMEPSQEQEIEVELKNASDRAVTVNTQICTAVTNQSGAVEYGNAGLPTDRSLEYLISDILTGETEVTVPAHTERLFRFQIKMPEKGFEGLLAGGIVFQIKPEEEPEKEPEEKTGGGIKELGKGPGLQAETVQTSIASEAAQAAGSEQTYTYVIAVILRESEAAVNPQLNLTRVFMDESKGDSSIKANIQNEAAGYASHVSIDAYVSKKGSSKVLYEKHGRELQIAPNSNFDYRITAPGEQLEEGEYTLQLELTSEEGSWEWEEHFTIGDTGGRWGGYLIAAGVILTAAAAFVLIRRKQKQEEALIEAIKSLMRSM